MNRQTMNTFWIVFTILIIISIFISPLSVWYFPVNLVLLIALYFTYYFFMRTGQYAWAIFEGVISAIWFDSYFKSPFVQGTAHTISICFAIIGTILTIIAVIFEIRKHEGEE